MIKQPTIAEVAAKLQRRSEDRALMARTGAANGKLLASLEEIARMADDMAALAILVRKLDKG